MATRNKNRQAAPERGPIELEFMQWELRSRDTIDLKRCYIDLAGDLVGGVLLSQIIYWFLPDQHTGKSKLTVVRGGRQWLAKAREDWHAECRISPREFDRAIKGLEELGVVETEVFRFGVSTAKHITLCVDRLVDLLRTTGGLTESGITQNVNQELRKQAIGSDAKRKTGVAESVIPYKEEITAKTTAEITAQSNTPLPPSRGVNISPEIQRSTSSAAAKEFLDRAKGDAVGGMLKDAVPRLTEPTARVRAAFNLATDAVYRHLMNTSLQVGTNRPGVPQLKRDGAEEWKRCFESMAFEEYELAEGRMDQLSLVVLSDKPGETQRGFMDYRPTWTRAFAKFFFREPSIVVRSRGDT